MANNKPVTRKGGSTSSIAVSESDPSLASIAADIKSFRDTIEDRFTTFEKTLSKKISEMIDEQLKVFRDDIKTRTAGLEERIRAIELRHVDPIPMDEIKQQIYEACSMDTEKSTQSIAALHARAADAQQQSKMLQNEIDHLEQYSRRNSLIFHGIPEIEKDTNDAVMKICKTTLGLKINRQWIDRSHRLGKPGEKPRPVIVKLVSYGPRNEIFTAKRKLKGTRIVITESLTKRRSDLLKKARATENVTSTWTIDGRVVCLLANGRKVSCINEQELKTMLGHI